MTHTVLDVVQPVATAESHVARGVRAEKGRVQTRTHALLACTRKSL